MSPLQGKKVREILEQALKERSPSKHKLITETGSLSQFLDNLMGEYVGSVDEAMQAAINQNLGKMGTMEAVQVMSTAQLEAERNALEQVIERIDAITESRKAS